MFCVVPYVVAESSEERYARLLSVLNGNEKETETEINNVTDISRISIHDNSRLPYTHPDRLHYVSCNESRLKIKKRTSCGEHARGEDSVLFTRSTIFMCNFHFFVGYCCTFQLHIQEARYSACSVRQIWIPWEEPCSGLQQQQLALSLAAVGSIGFPGDGIQHSLCDA